MSGLFGIIGPRDCRRDLFYGTDYHSHLGSAKAGLATYYGGRFNRAIHDISRSQFKTKFSSELEHLPGKLGVGAISDYYSQPIIITSRRLSFAITLTGQLNNKAELVNQLTRAGASFSEINRGQINSLEVAGKIIAGQDDIVSGINYFFSQLEGSASMLLLSAEGIYAARDKGGRSGLVIGRRDKFWAAASESSSLPNLGFHKAKELSAGEVVLLTKQGLRVCQSGQEEKKACAFSWIYTGFPASSYEGISVEKVRERSGACLARRDAQEGLAADLVAGIPDSGSAHAIGYAKEAGIPYRRILLKYTAGYGRSYIPAEQSRRDEIAAKKLIPVPELIKDRKIVICDDSIVRGTQLRNQVVERLWDYGAKEIHARIACPPLLYPCPYFLSTRSKEELATQRAIKNIKDKDCPLKQFCQSDSRAYRAMVDKISKRLQVTSLKYQRLADMQEAIGLPAEQLCFYCWRGED